MTFEEYLTSQKFTNIECLTEGACGYSYKAYDQSLKRNVFVKFYETCSEANEGILAEPRKIVSLFSNNNEAALHIAAVYSAELVKINEEDYIQIVTEYCEGESLYTYLKKNKLYVYDALEFGKQIIDGIHVLHQQNIVHRDIKPSNLVLSNGNIKIIDLGGAKELPEKCNYLKTPSKHSIFYCPPESFDPNNIYGKFSDIYQIGLVIYEMINGTIEPNVEHYIVPKIKKALEKQYNCTYEKMGIFEQNQVQNNSIKYLIDKNLLKETGRAPSRWYVKKLQEIINSLTNNNLEKRIDSCSYARIELSSYKGPNWKIENNYLYIKDFNSNDFIFTEDKNGNVVAKKSKTGINSFKKVNSIKSWDDVYKNFFKKYD